MNFGPVAGIDVSKRFSDMCILSPDNKIFAQEKIYHDETSINRANTLLQKAEQIFFQQACYCDGIHLALPLDSISVLLGAWIRSNSGESTPKQFNEGFLY